jgi:hypothetical protein
VSDNAGLVTNMEAQGDGRLLRTTHCQRSCEIEIGMKVYWG